MEYVACNGTKFWNDKTGWVEEKENATLYYSDEVTKENLPICPAHNTYWEPFPELVRDNDDYSEYGINILEYADGSAIYTSESEYIEYDSVEEAIADAKAYIKTCKAEGKGG